MESSAQASGAARRGEEQVFQQEPATRVVAGVGAAFFLLVATLPLLLHGPLSGRWLVDGGGMALAVLLALASARGLLAAGGVFVVRERGIARRGRGDERWVAWEEVAEVRAPAGMSRRLELMDAGGELLLAVPYDLKGFDALQRLVLERTSAFRRGARQNEFATVGQHAPLVIAVAVAALGGWFATRDARSIAWTSWATAALFLVVWAYAFRRLELDAGGVTLRALLRHRRVEWGEVVSVRLVHVASRDGSARRQVVRLDGAGGAPVDLPPVPRVMQLYDSVSKAWREARGPQAAPTE